MLGRGEHGRKELGEVGKEVPAVVVRHPDEDVLHANLYHHLP